MKKYVPSTFSPFFSIVPEKKGKSFGTKENVELQSFSMIVPNSHAACIKDIFICLGTYLLSIVTTV